ncbi:MAG: hypothetical protein EHM71_05850 [Zetaproteobacteria bacterium]|nr:MAG: hypothetical protein EHM71_05850 [Zetaproteobacteria bacterium]
MEASVNQAKEHATRPTVWTRSGAGCAHRIEPHDVVARGRQRRRVHARSLLCFCAGRELGVSLSKAISDTAIPAGPKPIVRTSR